MTFIAKLVTISKFKNITDKLRSFVYFQSELENVTVKDGDKVAVLQIESTESYFPVFIEEKPSIKQIESKLAQQDTKLNAEARRILLEYLPEK